MTATVQLYEVQLDENETIIGGTGSCIVSGCGCQGFVSLGSTAPDPTCIGVNAAGGTCDHLMSQHS
jgi:hypothetical protein